MDTWLDVWAELREDLRTGGLRKTRLLEEASWAQRLLVTVQRMEQESENLVDRFVDAWRN